jgi:hypothetical protein
MLWTGASVPWVSLPDKRRPRRQVQGGINQAFCCLGIQTPRQHHPRRSGCDEDRKGLAMVLCGSRRRRRAGWGAELVAVAVPRQAQYTGVQPACPIVRAEPVSDGYSARNGLRRLILITEVSAACQASSQCRRALATGRLAPVTSPALVLGRLLPLRSSPPSVRLARRRCSPDSDGTDGGSRIAATSTLQGGRPCPRPRVGRDDVMIGLSSHPSANIDA